MTDSPISTQKHHDILVVTSNNPPVNALGAAVRQGLVAAIEQAIREIHSYEVPEILALPVTAGSPDYLKWLDDELLAE